MEKPLNTKQLKYTPEFFVTTISCLAICTLLYTEFIALNKDDPREVGVVNFACMLLWIVGAALNLGRIKELNRFQKGTLLFLGLQLPLVILTSLISLIFYYLLPHIVAKAVYVISYVVLLVLPAPFFVGMSFIQKYKSKKT